MNGCFWTVQGSSTQRKGVKSRTRGTLIHHVALHVTIYCFPIFHCQRLWLTHVLGADFGRILVKFSHELIGNWSLEMPHVRRGYPAH